MTPDLFASAKADRKAEVKRLTERTVPIAQRIGLVAKERGIIAENLRIALVQESIIPQKSPNQRSLSWLPSALRKADFVPTNRVRKPQTIKSVHGKSQLVWVLRQFYIPGSGDE